MLFVNHIASLVHDAVQRCGGMPNKNIGENFLCIWKLQVPPAPKSTRPPGTRAHRVVALSSPYRNRAAAPPPLARVVRARRPPSSLRARSSPRATLRSQR